MKRIHLTPLEKRLSLAPCRSCLSPSVSPPPCGASALVLTNSSRKEKKKGKFELLWKYLSATRRGFAGNHASPHLLLPSVISRTFFLGTLAARRHLCIAAGPEPGEIKEDFRASSRLRTCQVKQKVSFIVLAHLGP